MKSKHILTLALLVSIILVSCQKEEDERVYWALEGTVSLSLTDLDQNIDTTYYAVNSQINIAIDPLMNHVFQQLVPIIKNRSATYTTAVEEGIYYVQVKTSHKDKSLDGKELNYTIVSKVDTIRVFSKTNIDLVAVKVVTPKK